MIRIEITCMLSSIKINIRQSEILSSKLGFGTEVSKTLYDYIEDIKDFMKLPSFIGAKGIVEIAGKVFVITKDNIESSLLSVCQKLSEILEDKLKIKTHDYEIYFASKLYEEKFKDCKTLTQLLKAILDIKFDEVKIYTNCGISKTYLNHREDCVITMIQYKNSDVNLIFKNMTEEKVRKIITYHLKSLKNDKKHK